LVTFPSLSEVGESAGPFSLVPMRRRGTNSVERTAAAGAFAEEGLHRCYLGVPSMGIHTLLGFDAWRLTWSERNRFHLPGVVPLLNYNISEKKSLQIPNYYLGRLNVLSRYSYFQRGG
jgi:hypothetical protein